MDLTQSYYIINNRNNKRNKWTFTYTGSEPYQKRAKKKKKKKKTFKTNNKIRNINTNKIEHYSKYDRKRVCKES